MKIELSDEQLSLLADKVADRILKKKPVKNSGFLKINEVGRLLNKCDMTIRRLMRKDPAFPAGIMIGGEYLFEYADIEKYINIKKSDYKKTFLRGC